MGRGEVDTGFWWGNMRERDHLEDTGVDNRVILKCIFKNWDGDMDRIDMGQNRESWRALLKTVMNVCVV